MKRRTIRLVIVLGTLSICGIILTQLYWIRQAFLLKEREFNLTVTIALKNVAQGILKYNHNPSPLIDPVLQLSPNYYTVQVNDKIDPKLLEGLLRNELIKRGIKNNVICYIYDCIGKKIEYTGYLRFDGSSEPLKQEFLPKWKYDNYYFAVYFPVKPGGIFEGMEIWALSTLIVMGIVLVFAYLLFVIFKQKRLSEVQQDFVNNMAHEFRTPITTIIISTEVLKEPQIKDNSRRLFNYIGIIEEEAIRLRNHIDRILQMSLAEKEDINLKKEYWDVNELIKKVSESTAFTTPNNSIFTFNFAAQKTITIDRLHFTNIIYNIFDNAVKYSIGKAQITVTTEDASNGILIAISDKGIGIAYEEQKKIFNRFYRVYKGDVHDVKGFGLGLHYVKCIVKAHKGSITLKSELNKGSCFTIFLPYA